MNFEQTQSNEIKINIKQMIKLCRPKQWIKNGFVFAAIVFSGHLFNIFDIMNTIVAFFLFSFISSTIYIVNDIADVEEDRNHPKKKLRPIASGKVSINQAKFLAIFLLIIVVTGSLLLDIRLSLILMCYFVVNLLYCFKLKKLMLIDVMTIAFGFILRVLAGAVAIDVQISSWLLICTGLLSLYLGFGKRKNELIVLMDKSSSHRETLKHYSLEYLNRILLVVLGLTIMTYILYTINGTQYKNMIFTIPFVLYGTFRYEYLIINKNSGGSPEDTFLEDKPFLINVVFWIIVAAAAIYFK